MNSTRSRIYVDFDDVLCETARCLCALLEAEFGKRVPYEEVRHFELDRAFGLTAAEVGHLLDAVHRPENLGRIEPAPGARATLGQLQARGCEICIVTGRPPSTASTSREWLSEYAMPYDRLLFVDKYGRLPSGPDVTTLADLAGMEFAFAIEDAPAMLRFLVSATPTPVLIHDRPWNANFEATVAPNGRLITRCRSWSEIGCRAEEILDVC